MQKLNAFYVHTFSVQLLLKNTYIHPDDSSVEIDLAEQRWSNSGEDVKIIVFQDFLILKEFPNIPAVYVGLNIWYAEDTSFNFLSRCKHGRHTI